VHFIDNKDLIATLRRSVSDIIDHEFADFLDLRIGGGVEFDHIEATPFGD